MDNGYLTNDNRITSKRQYPSFLEKNNISFFRKEPDICNDKIHAKTKNFFYLKI